MFVPILAINGDMGWTPSDIRQKVAIIRLWNRLVAMEDNRLTKSIFKWDKNFNNSWSFCVKSLLDKLGMIEAYNSETVVSPNAVWAILFEESCNRWAENIYQKPKLRTYVKFKEAYTVEPYEGQSVKTRLTSTRPNKEQLKLKLHVFTV